VNPPKCSDKQRKRCRRGGKAVGAVCVSEQALVTMPIHKALQDDLTYARDYLVALPQRIREVQEAADAVLKVGKRQ